MDDEKALSVFTETQRRRINSVRMYLGVTWLSEICTIDGTSLVEGIGDDNIELPHENTLPKPAQVKPNTRSWALWDRLLQSFTQPNKSKLKEPLGDWYRNHSRYGRWNAYRENSHNVYSWNPIEKDWTKYRAYGNRLIKSRLRVKDIKYKIMKPIQIK